MPRSKSKSGVVNTAKSHDDESLKSLDDDGRKGPDKTKTKDIGEGEPSPKKAKTTDKAVSDSEDDETIVKEFLKFQESVMAREREVSTKKSGSKK